MPWIMTWLVASFPKIDQRINPLGIQTNLLTRHALSVGIRFVKGDFMSTEFLLGFVFTTVAFFVLNTLIQFL